MPDPLLLRPALGLLDPRLRLTELLTVGRGRGFQRTLERGDLRPRVKQLDLGLLELNLSQGGEWDMRVLHRVESGT